MAKKRTTARSRGSEGASVVKDARRQTVAVIGLGYVGLPLARAMHSAGHRVLGVDIDPAKVRLLKGERCYLRHLGDGFVRSMAKSGRFAATTDASRLAEADAVLICVPTPLDDAGDPDLSYVETTTMDAARALRARGRSQLVVLESTTYPGTTREVVGPILAASGVEHLLAYSPERVDPGRDVAIERVPKLVGGVDRASADAAVALYRTAFRKVIRVSSAEVAEAAKLLENVYRAVNIALVNEMKVVLDRLGIDVWEVIAAAATKPYGFEAFYPGPGLGGHCIPIDPFYLSWKARQAGVEAQFIELAGRVNHSMPKRVVDATMHAVAEERGTEEGGDGEPVRVLILGLAYKPDIDDVRESPSFELIRLFRETGCEVEYSDPHVPRTHSMRRYGEMNLKSVAITPGRLRKFDAVVVATAHRAFDWKMIRKFARLIVDTRGVMRGDEVAGDGGGVGGGRVVRA